MTESLPVAHLDPGGDGSSLRDRAGASDFQRIYQAEVGFVWNRLRRLGVAERDLEDKVHDVFMVVHRRLPSYQPSSSLRAWLAAISVRVALDQDRKSVV